MAISREKEIRRHFDRPGRPGGEDKEARNDKPDIEPLIRYNDGIKAGAARTDTVLGAQADESQIVHEQGPDDGGEHGVESKPHEGIAEVLEGEHFDERAKEIKEVVHELERPADQGEGMDQGARPKEEDGDEGDADVGPGDGGPVFENAAGVFGQEGEGEALNNAGERELDVDDNLIQLGAPGGRRFHEPSRSESAAMMSTVAAVRQLPGIAA